MKRLIVLISASCFLSIVPYTQVTADAEEGKEFFKDVQGGNCRTCHSTKDTKLVGPGLGSVMLRHSEEWVRMFLTDPQKTWEMDHPETIELKERVRGMKSKYTRCQKSTMTDQTKDNLIDFLKSITVNE